MRQLARSARRLIESNNFSQYVNRTNLHYLEWTVCEKRELILSVCEQNRTFVFIVYYR